MSSQLESQIAKKLNKQVTLTITDNQSTIISLKNTSSALALRLHHMFLNAKETVINDLVSYIKTGRSKALDHFININRNKIKSSRKKYRISHQGETYHLGKLYQEINAEYFNNQITCQITWSKTNNNKNKRSIRFGSYYPEYSLIRIHKALDKPYIPEFFIKYIIYHEMLHAIIKRTTTKIHTKEFNKAERQFRFYKEAILWEKENLHYFLRIRKRKKTLTLPEKKPLSQPSSPFWTQRYFPF